MPQLKRIIAMMSNRAASSLVLMLAVAAYGTSAETAIFFRGVNLAGPSITMDGQLWRAGNDPTVRVAGSEFEDQSVELIPKTDAVRSQMIRSSRWGGNLDIELLEIPNGSHQVFVYQWEDNHTTDFQLLINDRQAVERFSSGAGGSWHRLGPFPVVVKDNRIKISARGGDANLSGIEVWSGRGPLPEVIPNGYVTEPTSDQLAFFESRIRPLLVDRCYECHSADADELGGGLLLDSRKGLIVGGDTEPPIVPLEPEPSLLIRAVSYRHPDLKMPPDGRLTDEEIADLQKWIAMGVPDPRDDDTVKNYKQLNEIDWNQARDFWSLRPIVNPTVPRVIEKTWPRGDLDRFILARLESSGLKPARDADKLTLIRRATFDLIGMPPTPDEIDAFLDDESDQAFARVIDRLLDSPHYGERWGRYWLDVVRYSDTAGDNSDFPIPQIVRYRDWVIQAFNRNLPYDDFVRQQLAGDLLPHDSIEDKHQKTIATGYIANARRFGSRVDDYPQHLTIEDTIDNLGRTFLASTINCARCHDHKFDPFTAADYYAVYGVFHSTRYPWPGIELEQRQRNLIPLADEQVVSTVMADRASEQKRLDDVVKSLDANHDKANDGSDEKKALETDLKVAKSAAQAFSKSPLPFEQAYAVCDAETIEDVAVQIKGNPAKVGEIIPRRFLSVLGATPLREDDATSGRLQLAEWIIGPENPLAMRAIVNRVWLYHFGKGIVQTPNDFGRQGRPPTHPELLDWLATQFRDSGFSMKSLHRTMMLSRTYQLSSQSSEEAADIDPSNELLSSFPRRRLDAEAIRDTILLLGGSLDLTPGGAHPFPPQTQWKFTQHNPFKAIYETNHRSVYLMTQRIQRHPFLAIFDGPDPSVSTPMRMTSTTPLQSLYFLNDPVVHEQAASFAQRILKASPDDSMRLDFAYRNALGRNPNQAEIDRSIVFLAQSRLASQEGDGNNSNAFAWQAMARVIFRLNEFIYVD